MCISFASKRMGFEHSQPKHESMRLPWNLPQTNIRGRSVVLGLIRAEFHVERVKFLRSPIASLPIPTHQVSTTGLGCIATGNNEADEAIAKLNGSMKVG